MKTGKRQKYYKSGIAPAKAHIIRELSEGRSLSEICEGNPDCPSRYTVYAWMEQDQDFRARVADAREIGYHARAEKAVAEAKSAPDPVRGRLAFDAERWYLGKLSLAFSDDKAKKLELGGANGGAIKIDITRQIVDSAD